MRLFFVLDHVGGRGGVETVVKMVTEAFSNEGHDVFTFLPHASDDVVWEQSLPNVYYYHHRISEPLSGMELSTERSIGLAALFHNLKAPDVVVGTHTPYTVLYSRMALGYSRKVPVVSWLHANPLRFNDTHLLHYADLHWAINKPIEEFLGAKNTYRIGNPIQTNVPKIELTDQQKYIFLGRINNHDKRLDVLFHALSFVKHSWTLDIFGSGTDELKLKVLADALGIQNHLNWHGWVNNPFEQIPSATALVLTSDNEGFPMVIGEAMARGIPVISTDSGGVREMVSNHYNGWLVPINDVDQLTRALNHLASLSLDELAVTGKRAQEAITEFSINKVVTRMKRSLAYYIHEERWT